MDVHNSHNSHNSHASHNSHVVPSSPWDPRQYERFREERRLPFFDLLNLVQPKPDLRVVDLGCGTGENTRDLHVRLRARETLGLDSSATMLAGSSQYAAEGLRFDLGSIESFALSHPYDLIFSNAALHQVPRQEELFSRLASQLTAEGQLAVQMPVSHENPTHLVAAELAQETPFREALQGATLVNHLLAPEAYSALLYRLGFLRQHVRLQVYPHRLASREDVLEWVKGSTLLYFKSRLSGELYARFLARYREILLPQLEDRRPFFYPFKRILIWASR